MKVWKLRGLTLALVVFAAACSSETGNNSGGTGTTDTGATSDGSGSNDGTGATDGTGGTDAGGTDAGATDTGGSDATASDAGGDTAATDTSVSDTTVTDTTVTDSTVTDATETDAAGEGSCAGKCGKYTAGASCQCDEYCSDEGDCCSDYVALCEGGTDAGSDAGTDAGSDTTDTGADTAAPECTQDSDCKDASKPKCDAGICIPDVTGAIKGDTLKAGDLFITEVMADSTAVADDVGEWFEVKNNTDKVIDLRGLQIEDKNAKPHTIAGSMPVLLAAGGFAVFCANGDKTKNGGVDCTYTYGADVKLTNTSDTIKLGHGTTVVIAVTYQDGISNGGWPTILKGHAVQLAPGVTNTVDNADGNNWCVAQDAFGAGDFGTPGKANPACGADADKDGFLDSVDNCPNDSNPSQYDEDSDGIGNSCDNCPKVMNKDQADSDKDGVGDACPGAVCGDNKKEDPEECDDGNKIDGDGCSATCKIESASLKAGDLVITEMHIDPSFVGDSAGEFLEVYNPTDKAITLDGILIVNKTNKHTIAPTAPLVVQPKGYIVMGINDDMSKNGGVKVDYVWKGIALGNSGSDIALMAGDVEVDKVAYPGSGTSGWPKYKNGASLQLNPSKLDAKSNDDGANWCESTTEITAGGDKGSPGKANEACK